MAFNFVRSKNSSLSQLTPATDSNQQTVMPKLTTAQLNQLARSYPPWLRENSSLKQLPGVYLGVLGQVQIQTESFASSNDKLCNQKELINRQQQHDYLNRFTDTERVHQLLLASRLPCEVLATIWAHVNKTYPGQLTNREVCLALALIAIFQRLENQPGLVNLNEKRDPFTLVKAEKKPPVPILYPNNNDSVDKYSLKTTPTRNRIANSKTVPNKLDSCDDLLIDISGAEEVGKQEQESVVVIEQVHPDCSLINNVFDLIDSNGDRIEERLTKLSYIWFRFMLAMKDVFKSSFDILNVQNSRQSALEALKSPRGQSFGKNLCLCYPLAFNIKSKISELRSTKCITAIRGHQNVILSEKYTAQIDDLMVSINEYWAVLINLLHESGLTAFIELIMDGLIQTNGTRDSKTIEELSNELDGSMKPDVCSICYTKSFLSQIPANSDLTDDDLDLVRDHDLLTQDQTYYYHAKCSNFWLNCVDRINATLPFSQPEISDILKPSN